MKDKNKIKRLIFKQLIGEASEDECSLIQQWREANDNNEGIYQRIINEKRIKYSYSVYQKLDVESAFRRVLKPKAKLYKLWPSILKYAVAILIPLFIIVGVWLVLDQNQEEIVRNKEILPGCQKATIVLSDGSTLELGDSTINSIIDKGLETGRSSTKMLTYFMIETDELIYNTIRVPNGGEYLLELSDGTKVRLNSGSELKFPVNFKGDQREVTLKGEAYFNVSHDDSKPFIVNAIHSSVKVYGTSFNVMSYEEENIEQITLVEGSIGVEFKGQQTIIEPGQQTNYNVISGVVEVKEVNTDLYTSWVDGVFRFKNMPMREIAKKLSRWYDVEFFFANDAVSEFPFTGSIKT